MAVHSSQTIRPSQILTPCASTKEYEGQGHISKLVKLIEQYARDAGYKTMTIGVEAVEARNLAIYLHWGYTEFVHSEVELEFDHEALILYYAKNLN